MSVLTSQDLTVRLYKYAIGNPQYIWVNTYEVWNDSGSTTSSQLDEFLQEIANYESMFHTSNVVYQRGTVSSWNPDSTPYNGDEFFTAEFSNLVGARNMGGSDPMPRHIVLHVNRQAALGRAGRLFYRGVLTEADVITSNSLQPALTPVSKLELQGLINTFETNFQLACENLGATGAGGMALIHTGVLVTLRRKVTNLVVRGVTSHDPDHKYFDRPD